MGLRRFLATTASMSSRFGPLGPGRQRRLEENSQRYFCFLSRLGRGRRVEGFQTMAERRIPAGRMNRVHQPVMIRSTGRRLGARLRPRWRISSGCWTSTDSATTQRKPPGRASRTTVTIKGTNRLTTSRILACYQDHKKHAAFGQFSNSPWTFTGVPNLQALTMLSLKGICSSENLLAPVVLGARAVIPNESKPVNTRSNLSSGLLMQSRFARTIGPLDYGLPCLRTKPACPRRPISARLLLAL